MLKATNAKNTPAAANKPVDNIVHDAGSSATDIFLHCSSEPDVKKKLMSTVAMKQRIQAAHVTRLGPNRPAC